MLKLKHLVPLFLALFFLILGLLWGTYFDNPLSEKEIAIGISRSVQQELVRVEKEAAIFLKKATENPSWQSVEDSFFLMDSLTVLEWTTNDFLPDARTLQDNFTLKVDAAGAGAWVATAHAVVAATGSAVLRQASEGRWRGAGMAAVTGLMAQASAAEAVMS